MRAVIAIAILLLGTTAAAAIECRNSPPQGRSAWRIIDGKRCWYAGHARISKTRLHWARDYPNPSTKGATVVFDRPGPVKDTSSGTGLPTTQAEQDEIDVLSETVWPALPQEDTFAARFEGELR